MTAISSLAAGFGPSIVRLAVRVDPIARVGEDQVESALPAIAPRRDVVEISPQARAMLERETAAAAASST
jgi:hypothetical protein